MRHPSLSTTRLITRFFEVLLCCCVLAASAWILSVSPDDAAAPAFAVGAAALGLIAAAAHILIQPCVHVTHHGRRLFKRHPLADALTSAALCATLVAAAALLLHDSLNHRGCAMGAVSRGGGGGGGVALSSEGSASKEAQTNFFLDDQIHQWPSANNTRSQAHVGWTMLVEVLFAGQLFERGGDPDFQRQLAAHVKRIWAPYTTPGRTMDRKQQQQQQQQQQPSKEDLIMSQIFDLGEVPFTPRAAAGAAAPPAAQLGAAAAASLAALYADEARRLDGFVTMHPENGSQPVDPRFVGYDMVETTLRVYHAAEPPHVVAAAGPYIKAMWALFTRPLEVQYNDLSDYEKVMVDAFDAGAVSFDAFTLPPDTEARRTAQAAATLSASRLASRVCSLMEFVIATCLLGALAFCGSAVLAGLELRRAHLGALPLKGELDGGLSLEASLSRAPSLRGPPAGDALVPAASVGLAGSGLKAEPFG